jgi:hypothetical protein
MSTIEDLERRVENLEKVCTAITAVVGPNLEQDSERALKNMLHAWWKAEGFFDDLVVNAPRFSSDFIKKEVVNEQKTAAEAKRI